MLEQIQKRLEILKTRYTIRTREVRSSLTKQNVTRN